MKIRRMRTITHWVLTYSWYPLPRGIKCSSSFCISLTAITISQAFCIGIVYCFHAVLLSKHKKSPKKILHIHVLYKVLNGLLLFVKKFLIICRGNIFSFQNITELSPKQLGCHFLGCFNNAMPLLFFPPFLYHSDFFFFPADRNLILVYFLSRKVILSKHNINIKLHSLFQCNVLKNVMAFSYI